MVTCLINTTVNNEVNNVHMYIILIITIRQAVLTSTNFCLLSEFLRNSGK